MIDGWAPLQPVDDTDRELRRQWEGDGKTLSGSPRLQWEHQVGQAIADVQAEMLQDPERRAARVAQGLPPGELTAEEVAYSIDRGRLRAPDSPLSAQGRFAHGAPASERYVGTTSIAPRRWRPTR